VHCAVQSFRGRAERPVSGFEGKDLPRRGSGVQVSGFEGSRGSGFGVRGRRSVAKGFRGSGFEGFRGSGFGIRNQRFLKRVKNFGSRIGGHNQTNLSQFSGLRLRNRA